jgi:transketolase C-terminal domain/subunit
MVSIAEELKAKLISSVVDAWDMNSNNRTLEQGEQEIETMRSSIAIVRKNARIALHNCSPINLMQLDVAMMFALPLMQSDLKNDDAPRIRDLFNQVMEDFADEVIRRADECGKDEDSLFQR